MEIKTFAALIAEGIQKELGADFFVSVATTLKNNSTEYTGILFEKGKEAISPTIYIDDLYAKYMEDEMTIQQIVLAVIERYEKSINGMPEIKKFSVEFEECKNKVVYRLISRAKNRLILEEVPYIPFLDMAITFHIVISISDTYLQSLRITQELQKKWNISVEQLYKLAKINTERILPAEVGDLHEKVEGYIGVEVLQKHLGENDLTNAEKLDMIIISNELGINGAAVVLYDGVLDRIAEEFGTDLYLLPSSIHEMIAVPAYDRDMYDDFSEIVRSINRRYVEREEILSDRVYLYKKDDKKFV